MKFYIDFYIFRRINLKSSSKLIFNNEDTDAMFNVKCSILHLSSYSSIISNLVNIEADRIELDGGSEITVSARSEDHLPPRNVTDNSTSRYENLRFNVTGRCDTRRMHADSYGVYYDVGHSGQPSQNQSLSSGVIFIKAYEYLHIDGKLSSIGLRYCLKNIMII